MSEAELRAVVRAARRNLSDRMKTANAVRQPAFRERRELIGPPGPELQARLDLGEALRIAAKFDANGAEADAVACVNEIKRRGLHRGTPRRRS